MSRRDLRKAGLVAGGLALSFLWAANKLAPFPEFPPRALAERIIRLTPGPIATFFIDALKHNALRLLAVGASLGSLIFLAVLPELTSRRGYARPYLAGTLATMAAIGGAFAAPTLREPAASTAMALVAGIMYTATLRWFTRPVFPPEAAPADPSRRRAMIIIGTAAAGLAVGGSVLGRLANRMRGPDTGVALRAPDVAAPLPTRPAFPTIEGLSREVTPTADHYVVDIDLLAPVVEAAGWSLAVDGLVRRPLTLSFTDIQRDFRLAEQYSVLTCISNDVGGPLIGNSLWTGIPLRDVLDQAGLRADAVDVVFHCADGYNSSLPVEAARDPGVMLAIAQNRRPLDWEHGFPCRLRAPAFYGVKNPKWITRIEVAGRDHEDYWTVRGWSEIAAVRTQSRIDTVGRDLRAGQPAWIAGVAWAGARGIARVEVSTDGGRRWQDATLRPPLSPVSWVQWALRWTPERAGDSRVLCRATDGNGGRQDPLPRPPHPSGATGYHEVVARVR